MLSHTFARDACRRFTAIERENFRLMDRMSAIMTTQHFKATPPPPSPLSPTPLIPSHFLELGSIELNCFSSFFQEHVSAICPALDKAKSRQEIQHISACSFDNFIPLSPINLMPSTGRRSKRHLLIATKLFCSALLKFVF